VCPLCLLTLRLRPEAWVLLVTVGLVRVLLLLRCLQQLQDGQVALLLAKNQMVCPAP
jgi:hypothetical protein